MTTQDYKNATAELNLFIKDVQQRRVEMIVQMIIPVLVEYVDYYECLVDKIIIPKKKIIDYHNACIERQRETILDPKYLLN